MQLYPSPLFTFYSPNYTSDPPISPFHNRFLKSHHPVQSPVLYCLCPNTNGPILRSLLRLSLIHICLFDVLMILPLQIVCNTWRCHLNGIDNIRSQATQMARRKLSLIHIFSQIKLSPFHLACFQQTLLKICSNIQNHLVTLRPPLVPNKS